VEVLKLRKSALGEKHLDTTVAMANLELMLVAEMSLGRDGKV
jgi:hypothetical protein